jgi:L-alanine-DL-glutamate epimerase-like enolase superfamily enzyme
MDRRHLLQSGAAAAVGLGRRVPAVATSVGLPRRSPELRISRIFLQPAPGRRLTPVAPNAYAPYRGYEATDPVLRIRTVQGLEGIGCYWGSPDALEPLLGLDPFELFDWDGDTVRGVTERHVPLVDALAGADVALFDLLGKALERPIADLLGPRVRDGVPAYDSSLYMEDLLTPGQREGLAYLHGPPPDDPVEMVARKAAWLLDRPGGIRTFKIKIGRARWMESFEAALARDVDVVAAVRRTVGHEATLLVDGNDGYHPRPMAAAEFALATAGEDVFAMEEMFDEELVAESRDVKRRLRAAGLAVKLADGETHPGGIPGALLAERCVGPGELDEPLFDIDQPDMNTTGYIRLLAVAKTCAEQGTTIAPHNFGSKLGFYAQVHAGLVTPNWELSEADDSMFTALRADGFQVEDGRAKLTGMHGLGVALEEEHLGGTVFDLTV